MTVPFLVAWLAPFLFCDSQDSSQASSSSFGRSKSQKNVFLILHFPATIGVLEFGFHSKNQKEALKGSGLPKCLMGFGGVLTWI